MYVMPDVPLGKALRTDMPATGRSILRSGRKPATFTDLAAYLPTTRSAWFWTVMAVPGRLTHTVTSFAST